MILFPPGLRWSRVAASAVLLLGTAGCSGFEGSTTRTYAATVAGITEAANAFLATLDDGEKKQVLRDLTRENATAWSNRPCGATCRPGIRLADLDAEELAAARSVLRTALGAGVSTGFGRVEKILAADDYLGLQDDGGSGMAGGDGPGGGPGRGMPSGMGMPSGDRTGAMPGGYSGGAYFLAFLGTPSTDGTWQLHFGGHNLAINLTYRDGAVIGATPFFAGVEPTSWNSADGTTYAPMEDMRAALTAMTGSLSAAERARAKLTRTYTDVLAGPGGDGRFPATKQGLAVGTLTARQRALVLAAIKPWAANADRATETALLATYASELDQTYIAWSGALGLTGRADYVRIDGPSVWVEFVCRDGVVLRDKIHYQAVYRDHTRDYGGESTFS